MRENRFSPAFDSSTTRKTKRALYKPCVSKSAMRDKTEGAEYAPVATGSRPDQQASGRSIDLQT